MTMSSRLLKGGVAAMGLLLGLGANAGASEHVQYHYDDKGRLIRVLYVYSDPGKTDREITFSYDKNGNRTQKVVGDLAANIAPDAVNDTGTMVLGTSAFFPVLDNDSDADEDHMTITSVVQPTGVGNSVTIVGSRLLVHMDTASPLPHDEVISYTISDGRGGSDTATLTVTVTAN